MDFIDSIREQLASADDADRSALKNTYNLVWESIQGDKESIGRRVEHTEREITQLEKLTEEIKLSIEVEEMELAMLKTFTRARVDLLTDLFMTCVPEKMDYILHTVDVELGRTQRDAAVIGIQGLFHSIQETCVEKLRRANKSLDALKKNIQRLEECTPIPAYEFYTRAERRERALNRHTARQADAREAAERARAKGARKRRLEKVLAQRARKKRRESMARMYENIT